MSFRNPDANTSYLTIIGHHPSKNFPQNFTHLINLSNNVVLADSGSNSYMTYMKTHKEAPLPNFIAGNMDSIRKDTYSFFEGNNVSLVHDPDENANDIEKTLVLANKLILKDKSDNQRMKFRIMIWALAGHRFDQLM